MVRKILLLFLLGLGARADAAELLFYCGITMVPAVMEAKGTFEKENNCTIRIIQGGSRDLCKVIETTRKGDLFLPGDRRFVDQCSHKGDLIYTRTIGYNRLALFVTKNNPHRIKNLDDLCRPDLLTILGNPATSSVGKAAEETLLRYGGKAFLDQVQHNLGFYAVDSRDLNRFLFAHQADVGLNWVASAYANGQKREAIEFIPIFPLYAPVHDLTIGLLRYSEHPDLARAFIDYLVSPRAKAIFKQYGFAHE